MAVDKQWLAETRRKNQAAYGMAGLGYVFVPAEGIVQAGRQERELRTQSIHAGRFEQRDPNKPTEGSIESIAQAIGPAAGPAVPSIPTGVKYALAAGAVGLVTYLAVKASKGSS